MAFTSGSIIPSPGPQVAAPDAASADANCINTSSEFAVVSPTPARALTRRMGLHSSLRRPDPKPAAALREIGPLRKAHAVGHTPLACSILVGRRRGCEHNALLMARPFDVKDHSGGMARHHSNRARDARRRIRREIPTISMCCRARILDVLPERPRPQILESNFGLGQCPAAHVRSPATSWCVPCASDGGSPARASHDRGQP